MAYRLHSAKKYEIEWNCGAFTRLDMSDVNYLLEDLCSHIYGNTDDSCYWTEIEIEQKSFEEMLDKLRAMSDDDFEKYEIGDSDSDMNFYPQGKFIKDNLYPREKFIKDMEEIYNSAAKADGYIHLSWF